MPAELEQSLSLLSTRRNVLGYLLLSRGLNGDPSSIIRHVGVAFEGETGRKYARAIVKIVEAVREGLEEVRREGDDAVRYIAFP
jgi:hypothetical protein